MWRIKHLVNFFTPGPEEDLESCSEVLSNKEAEENLTEEDGKKVADSHDVFAGVAEISVHEVLESKNCEEGCRKQGWWAC